MNKILPIILVVVLSGCGSDCRSYDAYGDCLDFDFNDALTLLTFIIIVLYGVWNK